MNLKLFFLLLVPVLTIASFVLIVTFFVAPLSVSLLTEEKGYCDQAEKILKYDDLNYPSAKRFSDNPSGMTEKYELTSISDLQRSAILNCGIENLPDLVSSIVDKRVGFLEGVGDHTANGKISLIEIETGTYLRFVDYEIKYVPEIGSNLIVPDFHVFLKTDDKEIYLEKLKERVGAKNYVVPLEDVDDINGVVIRNVVVNHNDDYTDFEIIAKAPLSEKPSWLTPLSGGFHNYFNSITDPTSQSKMIDEKTGRFEGIDNIKSKGKVYADFEEDFADVIVESFEITKGDDLNLYITKDGKVKHPSGGWVSNPNNNLVYVVSTNNDEILR